MNKEKEIEIVKKIVNSPIIHRIYPMIDRIDVDVKINNRGQKYLLFEIYTNDTDSSNWSLNDMYKHGLDPHYLLVNHIYKYYKDLLPEFKHIPFDDDEYNVIVRDPSGKIIYDFYDLVGENKLRGI